MALICLLALTILALNFEKFDGTYRDEVLTVLAYSLCGSSALVFFITTMINDKHQISEYIYHACLLAGIAAVWIMIIYGFGEMEPQYHSHFLIPGTIYTLAFGYISALKFFSAVIKEERKKGFDEGVKSEREKP